MSGESTDFTHNKTGKFFCQVNKLTSFCGLSNFIKWTDNGPTTKKFKNINIVINFLVFTFISMEIISFFTQRNLSEKQTTDRFLLGLSHPILFSYHTIVEHHNERIQKLVRKLCISLKEVHNDEDVEKQMIKKAKQYSIAFCVSCSGTLISYGFDGFMQVIRSDGSFTTVITAWPDVTDNSIPANIARIISYIIWWIFIIRMAAAFVITTITSVNVSYQYKNLQSYFYSLNTIFEDIPENNIDHARAEKKYEDAIKVGIALHSETLWCSKEIEAIFNVVISGQIIINVTVFTFLMLQMVNSERTLMNTFVTITTSVTVLTSTGFLMWNIGDATVEALRISTAMYSSGWQHCRGKSSKRICKLLVAAMRQSQKPVIIRSAGILVISYQSYLAIVKSSYSAFSLLY